MAHTCFKGVVGPSHARWVTLVAGALLTLAGCESSTGPAGPGTVTVSFAAEIQPPSLVASAPAAVALEDGSGRVIDIESVQIVIAEIELERDEDVESCEDTPDDDDCEEIEAGPELIDLPLEGDVITPYSTSAISGTFEELELELGSPEGDSPGYADFVAANPGWPVDASVRVVGSFDSADGEGPQGFDVFIDAEAEIEMEFDPPLVVNPETDPDPFNITVRIVVAQWFVDGSGLLIDPRDLGADDSLRDRVEENIEASFEAFEDEDRDGEDDED